MLNWEPSIVYIASYLQPHTREGGRLSRQKYVLVFSCAQLLSFEPYSTLAFSDQQLIRFVWYFIYIVYIRHWSILCWKSSCDSFMIYSQRINFSNIKRGGQFDTAYNRLPQLTENSHIMALKVRYFICNYLKFYL